MRLSKGRVGALCGGMVTGAQPMLDRPGRPGGLGRRPVLVVLVPVVLALIAGVGYRVAWHLWAYQHFRAAQRAVERYDLSLARAHLALCLEVWPDSAQTHFLAARTARRDGDEEQAEHHLDECSRLDWPREAIALERALLRAQSGDLARVEGYLLAGIRESPDAAPLILEALAQGYLRTYRLAEALRCLDRWLERQPDNVRALVWRGEVKERRNALPEAIRSYRRAVELNPQDDQARLRLAVALTRADQPGEAAEHFERLRAEQPSNPQVLLGLARCRRSQGRTAQARELLDTLLTYHPQYAEGLCERGKLALEAGRPTAAERWLRRALALAPFDRDINYNLVQCLLHQDKSAEARPHQARLERLSADLQRAADLTRKVAAAPRDPGLRHEIGVLLLRNGQDQEGLRWLHSALEVDPGHRPSRAALADYQARGQHQRPATGEGQRP
jgi:predicted Zn-dependent protease